LIHQLPERNSLRNLRTAVDGNLPHLGALTNLTSLTVQALRIDLAEIGDLPYLHVLKLDSRGLVGLAGVQHFPAMREILIANASKPVDLRPLEACPNSNEFGCPIPTSRTSRPCGTLWFSDARPVTAITI